MSITITLSWPSADLSQNARVHPMAKARAVKRAKNDAWALTRALMGPLRVMRGTWRGPVTVQYTFHGLQIRGRDDDNFIGRMKSARDGIALALGVDDCGFVTMPVIWGDKRNGTVEVRLTPAIGVMEIRES
jgi:hypothetical protein